ncbi:MFS multidrug transporter, putative [Trichophyton benhamiae CBS 112371]|uniref:MFS multidrug transporter, putative n=1 Tax=Arthroderma benhamiae (strain ATCC MYA-4681 / CBS 112371) TaxID=663331 RepID=D4ANB9_ARTBC|nr:MFS multidrug transporter, putative [Trichophyton benhamiae CBS 112371]EFE35680.1 MFS multidrug transporter, putative [Trichophyton benhamiae CBS 112371]
MEHHGEWPAKPGVADLPWAYELRSSEGFAIFAVAVAMFVIVPIIPKVLGDIGNLPREEIQTWIAILLASYGATLIIGSRMSPDSMILTLVIDETLVVFGYISDHSRQRKPAFFIGLISMAGAVALFIISTSPPVLVIARLLQGLAAGGVWVAGLALIANRISRERIGEAMGHTTLGMTWGGLLGPFTGIIYDKFGYYASFAIPLSLLGLDVILRFAIIEANGYKACSGDSSETTPCLADNENNDEASLFQPPSRLDSEAQQSKPAVARKRLPPMVQLLRNPKILVTLLEIAVAASILSAFEARFGWGSAGAGLIFLSITVPSTAGILIGKLADKVGTRYFSPLAFLLAGPAVFLMRYVTGPSVLNVLLLVGLLAVAGLSVVIIEVITMTEVFHSVSDAEATTPEAFGPYGAVAQAYAILNISFACGQFAGPLIAGLLKDGTGWQGMTLALSLCCPPMALFVGLFNWWTQVSTPAVDLDE